MNNLVSIITPNYNSSRFISGTIESVLAQTWQNWEMIIVDDCSTDGSPDIARVYAGKDARIKIVIMPEHGGPTLCRNKAIELSRGQYLAFLDSDDLWHPEKLERQLCFMQENDCDFSFTEYEHIDEDGNLLHKKVRAIRHLTYKKMMYHNFIGCLTVMIKQDINNKIYGPISKRIIVCVDYALFLQYLKKARRAMGCPVCLARYRIRRASFSKGLTKKIRSSFYILTALEGVNPFLAPFYMLTNRLIKIFWKYK